MAKKKASQDMAKIGHLGGVKGGPSRAKKLTSKQRKDIAHKGGCAKAKKAS